MIAGFILGFAACWLFAGGWVLRYTLSPEDWADVNSFADVCVVLIGLLVWPYFLPEYGTDD